MIHPTQSADVPCRAVISRSRETRSYFCTSGFPPGKNV